MLTEEAKKFIIKVRKSDVKRYYASLNVPKIEVDTLVSKLAFIYEKIRNAIDYKDDHLLRRAAILRIIKRRLLIKVSSESMGNSLIKELIRAGYLDNGSIPLDKIEKVDKVIEKYLALMNFAGINAATGGKLLKWCLGLCACEIEEYIMPPIADWALAEFAHKIFLPKLDVRVQYLKEKQKNLYIYLAIYRSFIKSDGPMLDFILIKYFYPDWLKSEPSEIIEVAKKINNLKKAIEGYKKNPLTERLCRLMKRYSFAFMTLREIILNDPEHAEQIFSNAKSLHKAVSNQCLNSYKSTRSKLRRSIVRVTIYIFITKMLLVLLLEYPYELYIVKHINYLPFIINALFPPILILFLGLFIRVPSEKNTEAVHQLARGIIYENEIVDLKTGHDVTAYNSHAFSIFFNLLFFLLFCVSFGFFIYILRRLDFNVFSLGIFLLFLSVVSFFGVKMRTRVRELVVIKQKENFFFMILSLLSLPFLKAGSFISENFSKINIFTFIFDFIIEAPFKIFLEVIEDWFYFLKEKKEEIYNKT